VEQTLLQEMVAHLRIADEERSALAALWPVVEPLATEIVDAFLARIAQGPETATYLRADGEKEGMRRGLRDWLATLLQSERDEAYLASRARIGRIHLKAKVPQRFLVGALGAARERLGEVADRAYADDAVTRQRVRRAICRAFDLDLVVILESYRDDAIAAVRRFERIEKNLLERRLQISESRYRAVVENAEVIVIAMDRNGNILLFNRKAEEISEYRRAEMLGTPFLYTLCHADAREHASAAIASALDGIKPDPFEGKIVTRSGETRWIRWHITTLASPDEPLACATGVDVTAGRTLEARTRRAERLASLGTLAAGLAHEIRNPLNAAQLQLMLVERRIGRLGDSHAKEWALDAARVVRAELERLAGLVEDFLAFARPQAVRLSSGNLCETVKTVASLLELEFRSAGVTFHFECEQAVTARFDEERIKQVLLNLIRNAIEAAGRGGEIVVRSFGEESHAVVEVIDSGPGVPTDVNIFEPFTTSKEGGTGLGLPIVHRIVSDHAGDVTVSRRDDKTVFKVELPVEGPPSSQRASTEGV